MELVSCGPGGNAVCWGKTNLPHLKFSTSPYKFLGKTFQIPKLDVEWYASGGFPKTGEMFMANEAGPELVGKMGNKTTVANQQQIIAGIEQGVYKAVMAAFSMQSAKNGKSQNETPTFNIYVGGRKVHHDSHDTVFKLQQLIGIPSRRIGSNGYLCRRKHKSSRQRIFPCFQHSRARS